MVNPTYLFSFAFVVIGLNIKIIVKSTEEELS